MKSSAFQALTIFHMALEEKLELLKKYKDIAERSIARRQALSRSMTPYNQSRNPSVPASPAYSTTGRFMSRDLLNNSVFEPLPESREDPDVFRRQLSELEGRLQSSLNEITELKKQLHVSDGEKAELRGRLQDLQRQHADDTQKANEENLKKEEESERSRQRIRQLTEEVAGYAAREDELKFPVKTLPPLPIPSTKSVASAHSGAAPTNQPGSTLQHQPLLPQQPPTQQQYHQSSLTAKQLPKQAPTQNIPTQLPYQQPSQHAPAQLPYQPPTQQPSHHVTQQASQQGPSLQTSKEEGDFFGVFDSFGKSPQKRNVTNMPIWPENDFSNKPVVASPSVKTPSWIKPPQAPIIQAPQQHVTHHAPQAAPPSYGQQGASPVIETKIPSWKVPPKAPAWTAPSHSGFSAPTAPTYPQAVTPPVNGALTNPFGHSLTPSTPPQTDQRPPGNPILTARNLANRTPTNTNRQGHW